MFHDASSRRSKNEHGCSRDVEQFQLVASRSAYIEHGTRNSRRIDLGIDSAGEERPDESSNLGGCLSLGPERP
jgi:hypothetical protein